jgi:hypothetical protein
MDPMSSENRRRGSGRPTAENGDRRDNEGDRRGRFACARRLLSLGFRPRHAELRPQRGAPAAVGGGDLAQVDDPPPRGAEEAGMSRTRITVA